MSAVATTEPGMFENPTAVLTAVTLVLGIPMSVSVVLGMFGASAYDPLYLLASLAGWPKLTFWFCLLGGFFLYAADDLFYQAQDRYIDELNAILKDIGEHVKAGMSIEAAVKVSTDHRSSAPSAALKDALNLAQHMPFDAALRHVAKKTGQPAFQEVMSLVAVAIEGGNDVGPAVRWLAGHLGRLRQYEKEFMASISSSLMMLRFIALLATPFLYKLLQGRFDVLASQVGRSGLDPDTVAFFALGVLGMSCLDGLVYGNWTRVPAKVPLYLGMCRFSLGLW